MSAIVHLLLAITLTLFLAFQVRSFCSVVRVRRARIAPRAPGRADLLWTCIPMMIVLFLAARSWFAVFDIERPAVASAVVNTQAADISAQPTK